MSPKIGAIAKCSLGLLGIITSNEKQKVIYNDGNSGFAWIGIQLENKTIEGIKGDKGKIIQISIGDPWSSKNPIIIAESIDQLIQKNLT